ncbi:MAG: glycosyltransferase [Clostridia bacterium]|nr:glycosyltransferase [Clostridia bacterium]
MTDTAVLFLSHLIPREMYGEVNALSRGNMQDAANALQWHLAEGFAHHLHGRYDMINLLPIASYPQYYKKALVKPSAFDAGLHTDAVNIGFCNVKYIRRGSIKRNLYRAVRRWCEENADKQRVILVYTLHGIMLDVLCRIKKTHTDLTVCAIVADLPDMVNLSAKGSFLRRAVSRFTASVSYKNLHAVDKFVYLTRQMADYIGADKPFCVMEGIAPDADTGSSPKTEDGVKTVLYTGTLHRKFGVVHLLDAFSRMDDPTYRLVICGVGDSEDVIREAAKRDPRIVFKGKCARDEVLRLQRAATVLVNPRMNNEAFTKYSFPSKNLEYLSSGVPLVAFKLDGIPDEYDPYIRYAADDTPETLAETIRTVCEWTEEERRAFGEHAARFVAKNKNKIAQTKRILEFLGFDL